VARDVGAAIGLASTTAFLSLELLEASCVWPEHIAEVNRMKKIFVACMALGLGSVGIVSSAQAADPYWRTHHDAEWQSRSELKDAQYHKSEWLRDHCVRDWGGHELCRR
jgi:hypothetical protein